MGISVEAINKRFGNFVALEDISVEVKTGSLVALLGPSGSGKSTLLRIIAGLERPDTGRVYLSGREVTHTDVKDRGIGFVFQHYALFKHLTVSQNIAFGLELAKVPKARVQSRVSELLELVQLEGLGNRYPSQLSGGQRQRVSLARALAMQPQVLLLDEPFGALDAKVRKELRNWLRHLHDEVNVTTVFVTHDQEEAMEVADELVVMNRGKIEQIGSAADLYDRPATPFVLSFIGPVNVLSTTNGIFQKNGVSQAAKVFLRPHDVIVETLPSLDSYPARVERIVHLGWEIQLELLLEDGQRLTVYLERERFDRLELKFNQQVHVRAKETRTFVFNESEFLAAQESVLSGDRV